MLLIFDWDGTLLDSTGKIVRCMRKAISDVGLPQRSDDQLLNIIGLGLREAVGQLFGPIGKGDVSQLMESYSGYFIEADQVPCNFYPGVLESLIALKNDGHHLAVATGKSRRGLDRVLKNLRLDDFFDATRCADESKSKPHPLMLHQILDELSADPSDAVMVGDTEYDLNMAKNANISGIAVSYGAHERERLLRCEPLHTIDHFPQLLDWVAQD